MISRQHRDSRYCRAKQPLPDNADAFVLNGLAQTIEYAIDPNINATLVVPCEGTKLERYETRHQYDLVGSSGRASTPRCFMQQLEIYAKLTEIFHDVFEDPSIVLQPEMTAADVPEWDSFNHINLIISTEAEFRFKFQTAELESMHNVGALVDRIEKKLAEQAR
jgi:acyl carrier protein